jgi:hypothetical protein
MDNISSGLNNDGLDDILWRIESVADWLKHEAETFETTPSESQERDISVRRYKATKSLRLQRRPTYLLRGI